MANEEELLDSPISEEPQKKKRTRVTRKAADPVISADGAQTENHEAAPKKRRGRPTKAEKEQALLLQKQQEEEAARLAAEEHAEASAEVAAEESVAEPAAEPAAESQDAPVEADGEAPADVNNEASEDANNELPKKKRARRSKEEIMAAAAAAAAALAQKIQGTEPTQQELPFSEEEGGENADINAVPEAQFAGGVTAEEGESLGLLEQLQSKVSKLNEEQNAANVWEGDPGDGTDFIIVKDIPVEDNAAIPYYDMFDNPQNMPSEVNTFQQEAPASESSFDFGDIVTANGVLELMPDGYGFLRSSDYNYLSSPDDVHLTQQQIKQYSLKTGDVVQCKVRPPHGQEKYFTMSTVLRVNGRDPYDMRDRISFENLTPLFPEEKFTLCGDPRTTNISTRIVDLFSPIGKGQRALIVAQPKTGKTILMKDIANAIAANHPEAYIMMLLIDERPEEVTDMARTVNAEVIASTFDEPADRHVKIAGLVLEKAKRMVESGHDVVIFLDSITRLARAYNTVAPASGKVLTGGVDANALQKPKRFFGAARNIENGGSLTIIATALTDTGSKMDEVIFEEFKGTGNSELQLDRQLANKRVFPAVNLVASSTRRDDLLLDETTINRMWILRNHIADMNATEAMNEIHKLMRNTRTNQEFLMAMNG